MSQHHHDASLETLKDIKTIMERSARFLTLSGWSGIWAGTMALIGAYVAHRWLAMVPIYLLGDAELNTDNYTTIMWPFIQLAIAVFSIALLGAYYFTWKKSKKEGIKLWNRASRSMFFHMAVPIILGGIFVLHFIYTRNIIYVAPACLGFYGLALLSGSKYTVSDIHYLGLCEIVLACISLFLPGYGLVLWTIGFGLLHILYGVIMWNKYEKAGKAHEE